MKVYYAVFKKKEESVEVEFPDLAGCMTLGKDWDDAVANATKALANWIADAEGAFIKEPSTLRDLEEINDGYLIPIAL